MLGRIKSIVLVALLATAALIDQQVAAQAQGALERLVMPGQLNEAHAKLESTCSSCHSPFSQAAQKGLCLDCHKPIAADIASRRGFHGLSKVVEANACRHCHTEHKGRTADIIGLDPATFDHAGTNFPLAGRHRAVACESCHMPKQKFRVAAADCVDCHRQVDPHRGQVSTTCSTCHNPTAWAQVRGFDHDKTKFSLTGSHLQVACRSCHIGERFKGISTACVDCHRQRDVHQGRNGAKCESCHKTTAWAAVAFDHDQHTKFPLLGRHRETACDKCHADDPHRVKPATTCISCHAKDDAHKGQLGQNCLGCHGEAGWKQDVKFDHALSRFPLQGRHATAKCEDCHKARTYKDVPLACAGCHSDAKSHAGRLGANCALCHVPSAWKQARFDHDRQTRFKLTGRHSTATCYSCHRMRHVQKVGLSTNCYDCHRLQDRHRGAFGRNCGLCHSTDTFKTAVIRN